MTSRQPAEIRLRSQQRLPNRHLIPSVPLKLFFRLFEFFGAWLLIACKFDQIIRFRTEHRLRRFAYLTPSRCEENCARIAFIDTRHRISAFEPVARLDLVSVRDMVQRLYPVRKLLKHTANFFSTNVLFHFFTNIRQRVDRRFFFLLDPDYVKTIHRFHRFGDFSDRERKRGLRKWRRHAPLREESQVTPPGGGPGVLGVLFGRFSEIEPVKNLFSNLIDLGAHPGLIFRRGVR